MSDGALPLLDSRISGVCPVVAVPFHDNGEVDGAGFAAVVRHLLGTGATALTLFGLASEFAKLADDERAFLRRTFLDLVRDRPDVAAIVSVTDQATHLAVQRAREAVAEGADAVNLLPPHFPAPTRDALLRHLHEVTGAVDVPVIVQHAPAQTGTVLDADAIRGVARVHRNLRAVKVESTPPGRMVSALLEGDPPLASLVGQAGVHWPDAWRRGAVGVQPGCSFTEVYVEVWRRRQSGDQAGAEELHARLLPYLSTWMQHVELIVQVEKTVLARRGLIASDRCRAPGWTLDAAEHALVERFLDEFSAMLTGASTVRARS